MNDHAIIVRLNDAGIHQDEHPVLHSVNLEIGPGEFVYLIGKTGSGKSSLLKALYADIPLASGEGSVCGFTLKQIKNRETG